VYAFLDERVADVMSKPVAIGPDATLAEVERIFEETGFNGLPVVQDGALVGFVSSLDLLRAFTSERETLPPFERVMQRPVASVMRIDPLVVQPRTPLMRVLEKMVRTRRKSFPVIDPHGDRLVGVVAREDVMRALRRDETSDSGDATGGG
jgi:CBS domain-containing protein